MAQPLGALLLSWLPNTEPDLAGYKIYAGRASGLYNASGYPIDVGNVTTYTLTITQGGFWYFSITAYNTGALESGFSSEIAVEFESPHQPGVNASRNIFRVAHR